MFNSLINETACFIKEITAYFFSFVSSRFALISENLSFLRTAGLATVLAELRDREWRKSGSLGKGGGVRGRERERQMEKDGEKSQVRNLF